MGGELRAAVAVAFLQGVVLSWLHHLPALQISVSIGSALSRSTKR